jgi:S-adenosylmethionine/arginine decarboxylase-like enzyme
MQEYNRDIYNNINIMSANPILDSVTFGMEVILDLYDCNLDTIRSKEKLQEYTRELCQVIGMTPYGAPFAERFGLNEAKTAGYSIVQLIETSSITGHFSEEWNSAYINIFSCKEFDPKQAAEFSKDFFEADRVESTLHIRK